MDTINVGVITIGQSPRVDMLEDMKCLFGDKYKIIEKGALDNFDIEYVRQNLYPLSDNTVLVSRMRNGEEVILAEEKIITLLQQTINDVEKQGCEIVILLCTGKFPEFKHKSILLYPQKIVHKLIEALMEDDILGIIVPNKDQVKKIKSYWESKNIKIQIAVASPYLCIDRLKEICKEFKENTSLILMDCMGYSSAMQNIVRNKTGKVVILPRNIVFAIVNTLLS